MALSSTLSIAVGAMLGAFLRWGLGGMLNPIFPPLPLGTLAANLVGGFLMGIFMGVTRSHLFLPEAARLGVTTGFLGALTTFSTFSGETVTLLSHREYWMTAVIILSHVAGSLVSTIFGIYTVKIFTS